MKDLFTNTFLLDAKIKLSLAGASENEKKKKKKEWFPLARKLVSTSRNKVIFQKLDFHYQKQKCPNERILFHETENRFPLVRMENLFKYMFLLDEKTTYIGKNIRKIKENCCQ